MRQSFERSLLHRKLMSSLHPLGLLGASSSRDPSSSSTPSHSSRGLGLLGDDPG